MSVSILRLGLWSLVTLLVTYVLAESAPQSPVGEFLTNELLFTLGAIVLGIIALGLIVGLVEKARFQSRNRCRTCGRKIPATAIYCRIHLNEVLEEEDLRHRTMNTRLPE